MVSTPSPPPGGRIANASARELNFGRVQRRLPESHCAVVPPCAASSSRATVRSRSCAVSLPTAAAPGRPRFPRPARALSSSGRAWRAAAVMVASALWRARWATSLWSASPWASGRDSSRPSVEAFGVAQARPSSARTARSVSAAYPGHGAAGRVMADLGRHLYRILPCFKVIRDLAVPPAVDTEVLRQAQPPHRRSTARPPTL